MPRLNFLVLLGNRYGWRPLPEEIPADEFERVARAAEAEGLANRLLLVEWGERRRRLT